MLVDGAFFCYAYGDGKRSGEGRDFAVRFASPPDPLRPHHIELRRSADGAILGNSPFLTARAKNMRGLGAANKRMGHGA
jgi:hypothetical protein